MGQGTLSSFLSPPADWVSKQYNDLESSIAGSRQVRDLRGIFKRPGKTVRELLETYVEHNIPNEQDHAAMTAGDYMPMIDKATRTFGVGAMAYHGSPHKFLPTKKNPLGEFDAQHIGKGEGAQAYGHGLYLADEPGVASNYKRQLSDTVNVPDSTTPIEKRVAQMAVNFGGDDPVSWLSKFFDKPANHLTPAMTPELARSVANKFKSGEFTPGGNLYKVDLPDEQIAKMLDWDAPLSEQPEVALAIRKSLQGHKGFEGFSPETTGGSLHEQLNSLALRYDDNPLNAAFKAKGGGKHQDVIAEYLRSLGITGIKYYDGGSRQFADDVKRGVERMIKKVSDLEGVAKSTPTKLNLERLSDARQELESAKRGLGDQTRNYVVFPGEEKSIKILERNGEKAKRIVAKIKPQAQQATRDLLVEGGLPAVRKAVKDGRLDPGVLDAITKTP